MSFAANPSASLSGLPADDPFGHDDPRRETYVGIAIAGVFFVGVLGWSLVARMDAAAYATGSIGVEGHRQAVQHREGGVVSGIYVKEGDKVAAGQVLVSLAPTEVQAQESAAMAQLIDLEAQRARLIAEETGQGSFAEPAEYVGLTGLERQEADRAMVLQRSEMRARRAAVASQKGVLHERGAQLSSTIDGYSAQMKSVDTQSGLIGDELTGAQDLAKRGYASTNRLRALQREQAGLQGQKADLAANAARSAAQIGEVRMQAITVDTSRAAEIAKDLRDVNAALNDLAPKAHALKDQLDHTQIRAPAAGTVVGMSVFTVGGVVAPGQMLMDIVPGRAPLVVNAQIAAANMDGLYVGQQAEVNIASMHDRNLPIIKGTLTRVSADSFTDEKSGAHYYTVEVTVPAAEAEAIRHLRGPNGGLRSGLPVQVVIPLRKRTAFQYLMEPLTGAVWTSFREH